MHMILTRWQKPEWNGWNPLVELSQLREEVNRVFNSPHGLEARSQFFNAWAPVVDLYEDTNNLIVKAELPGLEKNNIDVSLHAGALTISGERKSEQKHGDAESYRSERVFGRFQRTVTLPTPVEANKVNAAYEDGILTVTLPKTEAAKPKQIAVNVK